MAQISVDREELRGAIAGRVCRDLNADGACSAEEPGYPNLRLVLETGQQVFTDAQGRYHFAAVSSQVPDESFGGRLLPGRHRVRPDSRGLLPGGRIVPEAATVVVPMVGLALQDFAVQEPGQVQVAAAQAPPGVPVSASLSADAVTFTLRGGLTPGERIAIGDSAAVAGPDGTYTVELTLKPGRNELPVRITAPSGEVRFFVQRVDVVRRPSGMLIVPRDLKPIARMALPGTEASPAAAGASRVRVFAPEGTVVSFPGGQTTVPPDGAADVPVELKTGTNVVPLHIQRPGEPVREERVEIVAEPKPFVVGLIDLEASWRLDRTDVAFALGVFGRGAAHAEVSAGRWLLEGELELRDTDLAALREGGAAVLVAPRNPLQLERWVDPERHPAVWADDSVSVVPNAPDARVRLEARHPDFGRLGFGTYRATFSDAEVGRFHRELFGVYAAVKSDQDAALRGGAEVFASAAAGDPATRAATLPAHVEFLPTGGSLFFLPHAFISRGSEQVRIVLRDGLTGVPVAERHLVRGVDYELDFTSGRILLATPLSFAVLPPFFGSDAPTAGAEPALVVNYEYVDVADPTRPVVGGRAGGQVGPIEVSIGAAREQWGSAAYQLLRGTASTRLGRLLLSVDAAHSRGHAHAPGAVAISGSGGLDFVTPGEREPGSGWAFTARLRGPTFGDGHVDAAYRRREGDFSDAAWDGRGRLAEVFVKVEQPLGPFVIGALGDLQRSVDPRDPFGDEEIASRVAGGFVGYRGETVELRLEAKDQQLTLDAAAPEASQTTGGRTSVGAVARYRIHPSVWLQAAHKQMVSSRGEGPGAYNDTFSSIGADVDLSDRTTVGLRGGWGPELGPLVWLQAQAARGPDVYYGSYTVDVDGPDFGERRAVSGARTLVDGGTAVFVEDVGAHDATSIRLARAVGISYALAPGWEVSARYERGVRMPLDVAPTLRRDAGGASMRYVRDRFRAFGRIEARYERGSSLLGTNDSVQRTQRLASAALGWDLLQNLALGGRINWSDTYQRGAREARLLEASANLAWRPEPFMVVVHYGIERELSPVRPEFGERSLERVSIMPSVRVGSRLTIAAGVHGGWSTVGGNDAFVLSASLRPAVRVVGGLEVAAEVARRSRALDEGELTAVRGELGYRFGDELLIAGGYSVFGFSGLGLTVDEEQVPRVYLRAEAAW